MRIFLKKHKIREKLENFAQGEERMKEDSMIKAALNDLNKSKSKKEKKEAITGVTDSSEKGANLNTNLCLEKD